MLDIQLLRTQLETVAQTPRNTQVRARAPLLSRRSKTNASSLQTRTQELQAEAQQPSSKQIGMLQGKGRTLLR